jgi:hypothetical protein
MTIAMSMTPSQLRLVDASLKLTAARDLRWPITARYSLGGLIRQPV